MPAPEPKPIAEALPPPEQVRRRLADAVLEVTLLKKLLKLSERAEQHREQRGDAAGGAHVG